MRDPAGRPIRLLGSLLDLSDLKLADAALRESEAVNRSIVEASIDCVMLLDLDGTMRFMNASGALGMELDDVSVLYGRSWVSIWPPETQGVVREALATGRAGGVGRFTAAGQTSRGNVRWGEIVVSPVLGEHGEPVRLVAISRDITDRREAEDRLLWSATRDALTQLPNRALFQRTLNDAAKRAGEGDGKVGLLVLDLDHFKQVNDTLGHDAGDALLKTVASRLEAFCAEPSNAGVLAARLGGDEFALIVDGVSDAGELGARATALLGELRQPFVHAGRILDCHATIGAALFPDHGKAPEDLLKSADIALYAAKSSRRGQAVTFEPAHRAELQQRQSMIALARNALGGDRILPFYQPKVNLADGTIHGFEALLRWRHDSRGIQLPGTISAAFEDLELAAAISDRIIDQVIVDMRGWLDQGLAFGHVAVNAGAAEFRSDRFAESVLERLERANIPAGCFNLEVTETVFLGRGSEYVERALKLLSKAGVGIALDDFGTGYASLRHLKQFPVDVIKIDQSFVQNMEADPDDAAIVDAVLNLGRSLQIEVVAEGIEAASHARRLAAMGCHFGQGFLFSHAVAAQDVPGLVRGRRRLFESSAAA
jgi:diguanylate cyclase (GGDEF)-like protein/PAS domain S-box-containing protein